MGATRCADRLVLESCTDSRFWREQRASDTSFPPTPTTWRGQCFRRAPRGASQLWPAASGGPEARARPSPRRVAPGPALGSPQPTVGSTQLDTATLNKESHQPPMVKPISFPESRPHLKSHHVQTHSPLPASPALSTDGWAPAPASDSGLRARSPVQTTPGLAGDAPESSEERA